MLAVVYRVITITNTCKTEDDDHRAIPANTADTILKTVKPAHPELTGLCEALLGLSRQQQLDYLTAKLITDDQDQKCLAEVVIHCAIVIQVRKDLPIIKPLYKLLSSPEAMKGSYIPTFPGGKLDASFEYELGKGNIRCKKNHIFDVTKCQRTLEAQDCPVPNCEEEIPAIEKNVVALQKNPSFMGYLLSGSSQHDLVQLASEKQRGLEPLSSVIIRTIINACLTWTAYVNKNGNERVRQLINAPSSEQLQEDFFWKQLMDAMTQLSAVMGSSKTFINACFLIHAVLRSINAQDNIDVEMITDAESELGTEEDRARWENTFDVVYVNNIWKKGTDYYTRIKEKHAAIAVKEHTPLHFVIHDKRTANLDDIQPHLWAYHPRITADAFFLQVQLKDSMVNCPILTYLAENEPIIRATQYLPEILKLQMKVRNVYQWKLSRIESSKINIDDFLRNIKSEKLKEELAESFDAMAKAWELLKNSISEYSEVNVSDEHLDHSWDRRLPLVYILPLKNGPGTVAKALIDGLVNAHNKFLIYCYGQQQNNSEWKQLSITVKHIQRCHVVKYEKQLVPMLLSNPLFTAEQGQEKASADCKPALHKDQLTNTKQQHFQFDLAKIESSFVNQFVYGKPTVQNDLPDFKFREDSCSFESINDAIPQKKLSDKMKSEITSEVGTMQILTSLLDIVEIIMGFVSSKRLDPTLKLLHFVKKSLRMDDSIVVGCKTLESCHLEHVTSLWTLLALELAKRLNNNNERPFRGLDTVANFDKPLKPDHKQQLREFMKSKKVVKEELLEIILLFFEVEIKKKDNMQKLWILRDCLEAYSEEFEDKYCQTFPTCFLVEHVIAVWKEIANF